MPNLLLDSVIQDITTTDEIIPEPGLAWWYWVAIALGSLILLGLIIFAIKQSLSKKPSRQSNLATATKNLHQLDANGDVSAFAVTVSIIIRDYLNATTQNPALFQTSEELTHHTLSTLPINENCLNTTTEFLNSLNLLKYSNAGNPCDKALIKDNAIKLLLQLDLNLANKAL